jgi:hypothetical protein
VNRTLIVIKAENGYIVREDSEPNMLFSIENWRVAETFSGLVKLLADEFGEDENITGENK